MSEEDLMNRLSGNSLENLIVLSQKLSLNLMNCKVKDVILIKITKYLMTLEG